MRIFSYILMLSMGLTILSGCKQVPKNHLIQNDEERQAAIAEGAPREKVTPRKLTVTEKIRAMGYFPEEAVIKERGNTIPGFHEITVDDQLYYLDMTEEYLIKGDIISLSNHSNLTTPVRASINKQILGRLNPEDAIHFGGKNNKRELIVFTSLDCEKCRFIFKETEKYNEKGISVSYYPLVTTENVTKLDNIWCAKDRNVAFHKFYSSKKVNQKLCNSPVVLNADHVPHRLGVEGDVAVFTKEGYQIDVVRDEQVLALLQK